MSSSKGNAQVVAIISYLSLFGWVIALIINNGSRTELGSFHVRQALGVMCIAAILLIISGIFLFGTGFFGGLEFLANIIQLSAFIFWLLGFISAIQGKMTPVPVLGNKFQDWFQGI